MDRQVFVCFLCTWYAILMSNSLKIEFLSLCRMPVLWNHIFIRRYSINGYDYRKDKFALPNWYKTTSIMEKLRQISLSFAIADRYAFFPNNNKASYMNMLVQQASLSNILSFTVGANFKPVACKSKNLDVYLPSWNPMCAALKHIKSTNVCMSYADTNSEKSTIRDPVHSHPENLESGRKHKVETGARLAQLLYEDMVLGRQVEEACAQQYYRGKVSGFVHLYTGQEAISTGIIKALGKDDFVVSTYRDHTHAASKGVPLKEIMAELMGKLTGCSKGRGGSMHMFSKKHKLVGGFAYIGEQIPIALGIAFSLSYPQKINNNGTMYLENNNSNIDQDENTDRLHSNEDIDCTTNRGMNQFLSRKLDVVACFMGDGATNNGQFYESMNIAQLAKLPIIFVVENNNWAIGMAAHRSSSTSDIYKKAEAFGMKGVQVDGMDVLSVREAAIEAINRARNCYGPTLIEALTYRFRGHSVADPDEMRASIEKCSWVCRDPITIFGEYMISKNYANEAILELTQTRIKNDVTRAVKFAEESPNPDIADLGKYVLNDLNYKTSKLTFDELTPKQLNEYAVALKHELENKEKLKAGDRKTVPPIQLSLNPIRNID